MIVATPSWRSAAMTRQISRATNGASPSVSAADPGFDAHWPMRAPPAALLALRIRTSYSTRLAPCIRGHLVRNAPHGGFCIRLLVYRRSGDGLRCCPRCRPEDAVSAVPQAAQAAKPRAPVSFDAHADADRHRQLAFDGPVATLATAVAEDVTLQLGYKRKP